MIDKSDTAFMIIATALVMIMTPTLAFFYGGLVKKKNVLSILMQTMVILSVISIQWVLFGYSLAFGPDIKGIIGALNFAGLRGVETQPLPGQTIPHMLFMSFQMMFAIITPALIIGSFAERIKFSGFLIFILLWSTLVYDPMAHWVWAKGGWLAGLGALDFAGGTVIHITAGISALVMALMLGKRCSMHEGHSPHNLPISVLGAGFLWFGWFGFNSGSALGINDQAMYAFINTNTAAAAAAIMWMVLDWKLNKIPTVLGIITGLVAGLVAITPAAGFVSPLSSIAIGAMGSVFGFIFVTYVKKKFGYDDSLDVFGVHGIAGIVGALATGIFADASIGGTDGLIYGNPRQLLIQMLSVLVAIGISAIGTYVIFKLVDLLTGLRVDKREEALGLDLSQHHEAGYTLID
ncbi:MAG TPA: ammonium transporter [Spirochaetota bacterium]|nr:ammonium transporter [Spirochaetota bacterium]